MTADVWIAIAVTTLFVGFSAAVTVIKTRKTSTALSQRKTLSMDEIYRRFYADLGLPQELVTDLWQEIAQVLDVPAGKMRPSDEFGKTIGAYWITSDKLDQLGIVAKKRAEQSGRNINLESISCVDDYIRRLIG